MNHISLPDLFSARARSDTGGKVANWLEWCFFITAELDSTSLYVMRRHRLNNGLAHIYGESPAVVSQAGEYFRHQLRHVEARDNVA
jgi:glutathione S-transferase